MFKWIYQIGVKAENERIRRLIAEFSLKTNNELRWLSEVQKPTPGQIDKYKVNEAAKKILDDLMKPEFVQEYTKAPIDAPKE